MKFNKIDLSKIDMSTIPKVVKDTGKFLKKRFEAEDFPNIQMKGFDIPYANINLLLRGDIVAIDYIEKLTQQTNTIFKQLIKKHSRQVFNVEDKEMINLIDYDNELGKQKAALDVCIFAMINDSGMVHVVNVEDFNQEIPEDVTKN
jgi:hypothetical protein